MVQNKALVFVKPADELVAGENVEVQTLEFDDNEGSPSGGFTARTLYASFDPYLRLRCMAPEAARDACFELLPPGSVIPNAVLVKVLKSDTDRFEPGQLLIGLAPIQEYVTVTKEAAALFAPISNPYNLEPKLFLGPLGMPGLTAYCGMYDLGQPKKGETLFVSAASGAVGQLVGQLAKREGLTVIGCAGSEEKVKTLKEVFKFDGAFNHREGDPSEQLKKLAPDGIDSR